MKEDKRADSESELWHPKSRTPGHPARNSGCRSPFCLCLRSKSSHQPHSAWTHTRNLLQQHSLPPPLWQRLTSDYSTPPFLLPNKKLQLQLRSARAVLKDYVSQIPLCRWGHVTKFWPMNAFVLCEKSGMVP